MRLDTAGHWSLETAEQRLGSHLVGMSEQGCLCKQVRSPQVTRRDREPSSLVGPPAPFQPTSVGLGGSKAIFIGKTFSTNSTRRLLSTRRLRQPWMVPSTGTPRFATLHRCSFYNLKPGPSTSKRIAARFIAQAGAHPTVPPGSARSRDVGDAGEWRQACQNPRGDG